MPIVAVICMVAFTPWDAFWVWMERLPGTIQEEIDHAISHNLDGVIIYEDEKGGLNRILPAGKTKEVEFPPIRNHC